MSNNTPSILFIEKIICENKCWLLFVLMVVAAWLVVSSTTWQIKVTLRAAVQ
jgi:hypothetical protein